MTIVDGILLGVVLIISIGIIVIISAAIIFLFLNCIESAALIITISPYVNLEVYKKYIHRMKQKENYEEVHFMSEYIIGARGEGFKKLPKGYKANLSIEIFEVNGEGHIRFSPKIRRFITKK